MRSCSAPSVPHNDRAVAVGDGRALSVEEVLASIRYPLLHRRNDSLASIGRPPFLTRNHPLCLPQRPQHLLAVVGRRDAGSVAQSSDTAMPMSIPTAGSVDATGASISRSHWTATCHCPARRETVALQMSPGTAYQPRRPIQPSFFALGSRQDLHSRLGNALISARIVPAASAIPGRRDRGERRSLTAKDLG
jgi:hypothetical protein